jgi:hypothetical protein
MKTRLNKLSTGNRAGIPFKKNVDQAKKKLVENWKNQRKRDLDKKMIVDTLNVNGIPRNMVSTYKNNALNYIMVHKPGKAKMVTYKKAWLNSKKNTKNASPKPIVKAKRERML